MNLPVATQTVIVYRSKAEQMQDEAWTQLMNDYPEVFLFGFGAFFLLIGGFVLYTFGKVLFGGRNFRRNR